MIQSIPQSDPHSASRTIWVFSPNRTDQADLEAILVQRHKLLVDAVERVRESALTEHKHHLLYVGPRGCGKTHLVTLIVNRIGADAEASRRLRLAWLNEDETCTSLLELLVKIHSALGKRYPDEFPTSDIDNAYGLKPQAAREFVARRLLDSLENRTLVVVTENLDALFESLGQEGQQQLRAFIQEHPQVAIVATAQRLVDDLAARTRPFFGFFQTEHLKPLNVDEAAVLLQKIARIQGKTEVVEFLATSRGRSRVRALHHLSGGNHRIYIVLSQFITRESMEALISPFLKMVDELTPYYQERIRWLPPLQRRIVEMLCTCDNTVPVKEIARRLFSTPQTISSQLQDLREKGYVESHPRGRESLYEISEPLMRICVEVKENQNTRPLRLLVDFLRVWYDDAELERRLGLSRPETLSYGYLATALERNRLEGNLRTDLLFRDLGGPHFPGFSRDEISTFAPETQEAILRANRCWNDRDVDSAGQALAEVQTEELPPRDRCALLAASAFMHFMQGHLPAAVADLSSVIDLPGAPPELVAKALFNRGVAHGRRGDSAAESADYSRVIDFPGAPPQPTAWALFFRGAAHGDQGDSVAAIADYSRVIDLPGAPLEAVANALFNRGIVHGRQRDSVAEIADYSRVIDLPGTPPELLVKALVNRGVTHGLRGDNVAEILDYSRVIDLPGALTGQLARALVNRAIAHAELGDSVAAAADYSRVIDLPGAPPEEVFQALLGRGLAHQVQGDSVAAVTDYSRAIDLPGAPPEQEAGARFIRGVAHLILGQIAASQADFEAVTSMTGVSASVAIKAQSALALLHAGEGRWREGFRCIEVCLLRGAQVSPDHINPPTDIIGVLFDAGLSIDGRRAHAATLHALYAGHSASAVLGDALVRHLGRLFVKGEPWPASDNLDQWLTIWREASGDAPDFELPLRLLQTGIKFIKSGGKDPGILLDLTSPERLLLRQALGLEESRG